MSIKPGKIVISGPMCKPRFKPSDFPSQALSTMSPISPTYSLGFTSAAVSLKFGRSNQTIENDWSNDLFQVISNLANQLSSRGPLLPRARLMPQAYLWDWGGLCWGGTHISRKLTIEEAPSFYLLKSSVIIMIACDNWWHWATEKSENLQYTALRSNRHAVHPLGDRTWAAANVLGLSAGYPRYVTAKCKPPMKIDDSWWFLWYFIRWYMEYSSIDDSSKWIICDIPRLYSHGHWWIACGENGPMRSLNLRWWYRVQGKSFWKLLFYTIRLPHFKA